MVQWKVELAGANYEMDVLPRLLCAPDCAVSKEGELYYLTSTAFESLPESEDVCELALQMLPMIAGAAAIVLGSFETRLGVGGVTRINERDSTTTRIVMASAAIALRSDAVLLAEGTVVRPDGTIEPPGPTVPDRWLAKATHDQSMAKALRMFSQQHTWVNLDHVYEVVEADIASQLGISLQRTEVSRLVAQEIERRGWAPADAIEHLRETANWEPWLGDEARHGHPTRKQPKHGDPMSHSDAETLVRAILREWLQSK